MVSVFVILSNYFLARSILTSTTEHEFGGVSLGWKVLKRYLRLVIPVTVVFLLVCVIQKFDLYRYWQQTQLITESVRKESDKMNYFVRYSARDAILTGLSCLFTGTTKFTFVVWMLPLLFKSNMITILTSMAMYGVKKQFQILIVILGFYFQHKYGGSYSSCAAIAVLLVLLMENTGNTGASRFSIYFFMFFLFGIFVLTGTYYPNTDATGYHSFINYYPDYVFWFEIGAASLILLVGLSNVLQRMLSCGIIVWFGKISFGFYLLHDVVQASIGSFAYYYIYQYTLSRLFAFVSTMMTYLVITTIMSYLFYITVDLLTDRMMCTAKKYIYEDNEETIKC